MPTEPMYMEMTEAGERNAKTGIIGDGFPEV